MITVDELKELMMIDDLPGNAQDQQELCRMTQEYIDKYGIEKIKDFRVSFLQYLNLEFGWGGYIPGPREVFGDKLDEMKKEKSNNIN